MAISVLDSREALRLAAVADWPNMKQKDRAKTQRDWEKGATVEEASGKKKPRGSKKPLSTGELNQLFGASKNVRRK